MENQRTGKSPNFQWDICFPNEVWPMEMGRIKPSAGHFLTLQLVPPFPVGGEGH